MIPLIFFAAIFPRLSAIGRYVTPDELIWVLRSVQFREALLAGRWIDTLTTGHPGVITTWLGAGAITLQLWLVPDSHAVYEWITHLAWFAPENTVALAQLSIFLTTSRLAVILLNSLGVVAIFALSRKLFTFQTGLLIALLIAFDPFIAGLSSLLHVDGLMMTFAMLSLLALGLAMTTIYRGSVTTLYLWIFLAGSMAALAILSKSPAILLLPLAGVFIFLLVVKELSINQFLLFVRLELVWIVGFFLTLLMMFPALWASPSEVIALMSGDASRHIGNALRPTFFIGQMAFDHGFAFYPVTLAFRLSPVLFLGLILTVLLMLGGWKQQEQFRLSPSVVLFGVWSFLFVVGILFVAKKFDRYALAVYPALIVITAVSFTHLAHKRRYLLNLVVGLQLVYLLFYMPFPLMAYNPLVGGSWRAASVMPIGWGESISVAGEWLADQPDAENKTAVSTIAPALAPFFPGETLLFNDETVYQANFLILTAGDRQAIPAEQIESWIADTMPLHTIRFGGMTQAWIYERPNPKSSEVTLTPLDEPLTFDNRIQLLATQTELHNERLDFYAQWGLLPGGEKPPQKNGSRFTVKLSLTDEFGQVWTGMEHSLLNEVYFYPQHWEADEMPQIRYSLDLPLGIPPSTYAIALSLIDEETVAQLPLLLPNGRFAGVVYRESAIELGLADAPPSPNRLNLPIIKDVAWLNGRFKLLGQEILPEKVTTGTTLPIDLYWQATEPLSSDISLLFRFSDVETAVPISRFPIEQWRGNELIHEKYALPIPPELAAGRYDVTVQLVDGSGVGVETAVSLGIVELTQLNRLFTLPDDIEMPLAYQFNRELMLRGMDMETAVAAGQTVEITFYWEVLQKPDTLYSGFVHLIDASGIPIAQSDQWPGGLPSDLWVAGQIIIDTHHIEIPPATELGNYQLQMGIYMPENGLRLSLMNANGVVLDDHLALPAPLTIQPEP